MNKKNLRKLILSNVLVASALFTFLIWIVGDDFNFPNANGQTANLMAGNIGVEYDSGVFNISDVSIKYDDVWGPTMIGLIENKDPFNKIEGVQLSVQMYDSNDHLIGVMKGYPQSSNILPNQKTAFEIQSGDEEIQNVDHIFIEILATDWGTSSYTPSSSLGSNSPGRLISIENPYFSMKIPYNWTYANARLPDQVSDSGIYLSPTEFSDLLIKTDEQDLQNLLENLPVFAFMLADTNSACRNVPLEIYAQHRFNTSEAVMSNKINATIGGEKALKFYGTAADNSTVRDKSVRYLVFHDGVPYMLEYSAILKDFEKYLPQFENMVKSLRFVGSPSSEIENLSENENETNTITNFSGANLTEYTRDTSDSNYPEELYDECVKTW